MKNIAILFLMITVVASSGCGYFIQEMEQSRAEKYPKPTLQARQDYLQDNPRLIETIKTAIRKGRVTKGMSKEDVVASWGEPAKIIKKQSKDYDEIWMYIPHWKVKNYLHFKDNHIVGGDPDPDNLI